MLRKIIGKIFGSTEQAKAGPKSASHRARGGNHASPSGRHAAGSGAKAAPHARDHSTRGGTPRAASKDGAHGKSAPRSHPAGGGGGHGRGHTQGRSSARGGSDGGGHGRRDPHGAEERARGEFREDDRRGAKGGRSRGKGGRGRRRGRGGEREPGHVSRARGHERAETPEEGVPVGATTSTEEGEHAQAVPAQRPEAKTPAKPIEVPPIAEDSEFSDLGLAPFVVAAAEKLGYAQPTPIQSEAIPFVLSGRDVIGSAQTGTGKTAAFGMPLLQLLGKHDGLRCLVLEPTRELASQVGEALESFSTFSDLRTAVVYGGVGYGPQRDAIKRGLDVIVATPGRLLDHLQQRALSLSTIKYLVLDEVDRMLDMGFLPDVKRIISQCPKERQTMFFSATIPPELEKLTSWVLRDPHVIEIGRRRSAAETVSHAFFPVIQSQKYDLLRALLEQTNYDSVLVFCRTKHGADFIAARLLNEGHKVAVMHSNRSQRERTDALDGFKSGKYEVLVATDVAARGLDIAGISHVINYDTPLHPEDYVHRIGRTGRAESEGDAFTLLTEDETKYAAAIERFISQKVERRKLEGFPYQYSAVFASLEGEPKNVFRSRLYRGTKG